MISVSAKFDITIQTLLCDCKTWIPTPSVIVQAAEMKFLKGVKGKLGLYKKQ